MATELLSKANAWKRGPIKKSHKALVSFLRSLSTNTKAQQQLGYGGQNANWTHTIRKILPNTRPVDLAPLVLFIIIWFLQILWRDNGRQLLGLA